MKKRTKITLATTCTALLLTGCVGGGNGPKHLAPVVHYGGSEGAGSAGMHTVVRDENIWRISKNYAVSMQEIILRNKLNAPYTLKVGQRLEMPPPRKYTVRKGDTVYEIARLFNVSMRMLVRQNNLYSPYIIKEGQVLDLPMSYDVAVDKPTARSADAKQYVHMSVPSARPAASGQTTVPKAPVKSKFIKTQIPARTSGQFGWPLKGKILSSYGSKGHGLYNDGINIAAPRGSIVRAAENGVVVYTGDEIKGYGNLVLLKHSDGWISAYAHLDKIKVTRGAKIMRGADLGTVGSTGNVDTPQLHFELRRGAQTQNPINLLARS